MSSSKRIFGLDLMRAVAIMMVLCAHILSIYPHSSGSITQLFSFFGFWGVELFFVLSGFLVGSILYNTYLKEDFTIGSVFYFLKRRWYRTLPNYFLILILNGIIAFCIGISVDDIGFYFFFLQNFSTTMRPFFTESWSLSVEEFAYLLMPFALFLGSLLGKPKNKSKRFILILLCLIVFFIFNKVGYNFTTMNTSLNQWNLSLKAVVVYRIDAILTGMAFAWISFKYNEFWLQQKVNLLFVGVVLLLFMFVGVGLFGILIEKYPFFWNVLYLPITSVTFALFLPVLSQWETAVNWVLKPVTFISLISYSIYLLHYGIVLQLLKYFFDTDSFSMNQLHFFTIGYLVITFFVSYWFYKYYEKPILKWRDRQGDNSQISN